MDIVEWECYYIEINQKVHMTGLTLLDFCGIIFLVMIILITHSPLPKCSICNEKFEIYQMLHV